MLTSLLLCFTFIAAQASAQQPEVTDPNLLGCVTANAIVSICYRATPSLSTATAFHQSASCVCYYSAAYAPAIFDDAHSRCFSYMSTASPQYVASITSVGGPVPSKPCGRAGNILSAPSTITDTSLFFSQTTDVNFQACQTVGNVVAMCASLTPGFSTITDPKSQASCLCYSGIVWKPTAFDNAWSSCVRYYSTGLPQQYSSLSNGPGGLTSTPCAVAGDVRAGVAATRTSTTTTAAPTSSLASTATGDRGDLRRASAWMLTGCMVVSVLVLWMS
ncbi:hypothetical protein QBC44DRAFT_386593 [Cladorrhinum sp. PSN332]|nr:hypothetical protein QBC44DRAFT_386593 [Cladorrhinum sp. PSN332]